MFQSVGHHQGNKNDACKCPQLWAIGSAGVECWLGYYHQSGSSLRSRPSPGPSLHPHPGKRLRKHLIKLKWSWCFTFGRSALASPYITISWRTCSNKFMIPILRVFEAAGLGCCLVALLCLTLLWPHGLQPASLLCPWDFPGKNTGVRILLVLLQGILLAQGSNPRLLHCRSHQESPGLGWGATLCIPNKFPVNAVAANLGTSLWEWTINKQYHCLQFSSVLLLSHVWLFATPCTQHARPPCPSPTTGVYPNSCPLNQWCHPTISSSVVPFSSCLQSFQQQGLFQWVSSSNQVAKVLEFQLQHQSFQWIFRTDFL